MMEWWSDCLHSTRVAKKNVREAGTLRLRPGWADTTSAGAVRPRNSADDSQRPGGPTHKKGEASQLMSAFQAFDSTLRFFPGPYSPGKGCVGLPGLNRNLTRFDFTVFFCLSKYFTALPQRGRSWPTGRMGVIRYFCRLEIHNSVPAYGA